MRKKILLATIAFLFGTLLAWAGGTPSLPLNYQARIINGKFYVVRMLASPDPAPQGTFINSRGLRVDGAGTLYAISPAMAASPTIINSILGVAVDANGYLIVSVSGGSSMTWPSGGAGIPNYNGSSAWGTSYSASNPIPFNFLDTTVAKTDLSNLANPTAINLTTLTFAGAAGLTAGAEPVTITGESVLFDNPSNTPDAQLGVALTSGEGGGVYIGLVPDPNDLGNTESKFTLESDDQADNLLQLGDGISNLNWIGTNYLTLDDGAGNQTIGYNTAQAGVANSPYSRWCGTFKATSGPTYGLDCWNVSNVIGAGVNGTSALTFAHSGSSGALSLPFPAGTTTNISTTGNAAKDLSNLANPTVMPAGQKLQSADVGNPYLQYGAGSVQSNTRAYFSPTAIATPSAPVSVDTLTQRRVYNMGVLDCSSVWQSAYSDWAGTQDTGGPATLDSGDTESIVVPSVVGATGCYVLRTTAGGSPSDLGMLNTTVNAQGYSVAAPVTCGSTYVDDGSSSDSAISNQIYIALSNSTQGFGVVGSFVNTIPGIDPSDQTNTFFGYGALASLTADQNIGFAGNTAFGYQAGYSNTTGINNSFQAFRQATPTRPAPTISLQAIWQATPTQPAPTISFQAFWQATPTQPATPTSSKAFTQATPTQPASRISFQAIRQATPTQPAPTTV